MRKFCPEIIEYIKSHDGAFQSDLVRELNTHQTTIYRAMLHLEAEGIVERSLGLSNGKPAVKFILLLQTKND